MQPLYTSVTMKKMTPSLSDEAPKKRDKCIQMHYIGKNYATTMQPLYTSVTMKNMTPSLSETTVTSIDHVI